MYKVHVCQALYDIVYMYLLQSVNAGTAAAAGKAAESSSRLADSSGATTTSSRPPSKGFSLWDYVQHHHAKTPLFYNFNYEPPSPADGSSVLRPYSNISSLKVC